MKRLDLLIIKELFGPWFFGAAIFTVLIMAGQFLFTLTRYLSEGANPIDTFRMALLLMPGVVAKTFSMATLLATLLAFGRLSGDSEIVSLRAAGISLYRIMVPVGMFATVVAGLAFWLSNYVVPWSSLQAVQLRIQIESQTEGRTAQETNHAWYRGDQLSGFLFAKNFDISDRTLEDALIVWYDEEGNPSYKAQIPSLKYEDETQWNVQDRAVLRNWDGTFVMEFDGGLWPEMINQPDVTPNDLIVKTLKDLDALNMEQFDEQLERAYAEPEPDQRLVAELQFGKWNKISLPLAAIVFGLIGAPLGIRSHRTSAGTGFWLSVIIIFAYLLMTNVMSIMSQGGKIPAPAASFGPIVIGLMAAVYLIRRKSF